MHRIVALALVALAGCASSPPPAAAPVLIPSQAGTIPIHGATPGRICREPGGQTFIGQPATAETASAILRATNAAVIRWAPPGMMMTMEFSESRATVRLDARNRVLEVNCG